MQHVNGSDPDVSFTIEESLGPQGSPVLRLIGHLDSAVAPSLATMVQRKLAESPESLVIDLTATTYLDSRGARELVITARAADSAGTALQVFCPRQNRRVWRVFDLLGLPAVMPVVEDV